MKKNYLKGLIGIFFVCLVACQTAPGNGFLSSANSDQSTTAAVNTAFMNNRELAAAPIQVETRRGTVFLSGYVKTIRQSDMAFDVAGKVPGVRLVQNGLIVRK